jgi:hypothetical protein
MLIYSGCPHAERVQEIALGNRVPETPTDFRITTDNTDIDLIGFSGVSTNISTHGKRRRQSSFFESGPNSGYGQCQAIDVHFI